jgi:hypothetical protein
MMLFWERQKQSMFVWPIAFAMLFASFIVAPIGELIAGYGRILTSNSVLLSDYLLIGGLGATLFNAATTLFLHLLMLKAMKMKLTGPIFAALLTITGFAFFGKNIFNPLPMYFGIFLFAKATKTPFRNHIIVMLFSSGIAPIVSFLIFGAGFSIPLGIAIAVSVGTLVGFLLPAFGAHALRFHQGYNLYNTGFAMGLLSMFITGILNTFGIVVPLSSAVDDQHHTGLLIATAVLSSFFVLASITKDRRAWTRFPALLRKSGRLVTDFFRDFGAEPTLFNIGVMGFFCVLLILFTPIKVNGPVMGAILTVMGFAAFGKHPLNSLPVVLGAILAIELTPIEWTMGPILAVLFVTGIAPLAGRFGFLPGLLAGFVHLLITSRALQFQGGFDLYNNGFAAGFVAAVLAPIFHTFRPMQEGDPS